MKRTKLMLNGAMKTLPGKLVQLADLERKVSVVDQDIDGAELFPDSSYHRVDLLSLRHVRLEDHAAPTVSFNFLENFCRGLLILVVVNNNKGAGPSQSLRSG